MNQFVLKNLENKEPHSLATDRGIIVMTSTQAGLNSLSQEAEGQKQSAVPIYQGELMEKYNNNPEWFEEAIKAIDYFKIPRKHLFVLFAIIKKENTKWNPNEKNKDSSALGLAQFIDSTWGEFENYIQNSSKRKSLRNSDNLSRRNPIHSIWALAWNMKRILDFYKRNFAENRNANNQGLFNKLMNSKNPDEIVKYYYLVYFNGPTGAKRWLRINNNDIDKFNNFTALTEAAKNFNSSIKWSKPDNI